MSTATEFDGVRTYTGYTYVYASGIDPATVGYGSVGTTPEVGDFTLGASSMNPAVLSALARVRRGRVVMYRLALLRQLLHQSVLR